MQPKLTEDGVTYFLGHTLNKCNLKKKANMYISTNIFAFLSFTISMTLFLLYKYKGKKTDKEKEREKRAKEQYILKQIYKMQTLNHDKHPTLITTLPQWESEFDMLHRRLY